MYDTKLGSTKAFPGADRWTQDGLARLSGGIETPDFGDNADGDIGSISNWPLEGNLMKGI
jgi:hypothetical protein